jgi:hypothetical protein
MGIVPQTELRVFPLERMLCTVKIAVYIQNCTQHINTLCGHNADFFSIKPDSTYLATRLRGVAGIWRVAQPPRVASTREDKINILNKKKIFSALNKF